MATLIDAEKIKYMCSCKHTRPLAYLYYCKYCRPFALKCKACVLHEMDQKYYCLSCFDNKANKEAITLRYKCAACYCCPCCANPLIIRGAPQRSSASAASKSTGGSSGSGQLSPSGSSEAVAVQQQSTSSSSSSPPQASQKVYYLICGFCRWTSRDSGIPDSTSTPIVIKQEENAAHASRIAELIAAYKQVASREKLERERKKYTMVKKRPFGAAASNQAGQQTQQRAGGVNQRAISGGAGQSSSSVMSSQLYDKYGILAPALKRRSAAAAAAQAADAASNMPNIVSIEKQFESLCKLPDTVDSFEPLPFDDYFNKSWDVNSITTISQRHANPKMQTIEANKLSPLSRYYVCKESKRCNGCEHNVLKPESSITGFKFKLHQMAIFVVPEVRIVTCPQWLLDQPNEVILSVTNRTENEVTVWLEPLSENMLSEYHMRPSALVAFACQPESGTQIDRHDSSRASAAPALTVVDRDPEHQGLVCFRRGNKVSVNCRVTPLSSALHHALAATSDASSSQPRVTIAFLMRHSLASTAKASTAPLEMSPALSSSPLPPTEAQSAATSQQQTQSVASQIVCIDFGPLRVEHGLVVINKPKYIEECQ